MILFDGNKISPNEFPDKTPRFSSVAVKRFTCYRIRWYYESMDELITLMMLAAHIYDNGASATLYMPYVPNARMDRVHSSSEVFTLRHFCNIINSLSFESVHILDPHSYVTPALIDRVVIHNPDCYINLAVGEIAKKEECRPFFVFPDEGAHKRYSSLLIGGGRKSVYCSKGRDWDTGSINRLVLQGEVPTDQPALIVDDICSYGGTFARTAETLRDAGVERVYLYVTHCEQNIFEGRLFKGGLVDGVFTTNSIMSRSPDAYKNDITVFPLKEGFDIV